MFVGLKYKQKQTTFITFNLMLLLPNIPSINSYLVFQ